MYVKNCNAKPDTDLKKTSRYILVIIGYVYLTYLCKSSGLKGDIIDT